ncbi:hypothetical protein HCZ64_13975 [Vibrio campbellii]|nr:hypothetical protein [Vibrio campbellii]
MQGGKFGDGFASAAVAQAFSPYIDGIDKKTAFSGQRIAAAAILGGATSELTGGKFANGAAIGALARMFNDELHREQEATARAPFSEKNGVVQSVDEAAFTAGGFTNPNSISHSCSDSDIFICATLPTVLGEGGDSVTDVLDLVSDMSGFSADSLEKLTRGKYSTGAVIMNLKGIDTLYRYLSFGKRFDNNLQICRDTCGKPKWQRDIYYEDKERSE